MMNSAMLAQMGRMLARKKPTTIARTVGHRVQNAIAEIIECDGRFPIMLIHRIGIFGNFPGNLQQSGKDEPETQPVFAKQQPAEPIEKSPCRMWLGVYQSMRCCEILRTHNHTVPEFHISAFADRFPSDHQQNERAGNDNGNRDLKSGFRAKIAAAWSYRKTRRFGFTLLYLPDEPLKREPFIVA